MPGCLEDEQHTNSCAASAQVHLFFDPSAKVSIWLLAETILNLIFFFFFSHIPLLESIILDESGLLTGSSAVSCRKQTSSTEPRL